MRHVGTLGEEHDSQESVASPYGDRIVVFVLDKHPKPLMSCRETRPVVVGTPARGRPHHGPLHDSPEGPNRRNLAFLTPSSKV